MNIYQICFGLYVISCLFSGLYTLSTGAAAILVIPAFLFPPIGFIGFLARNSPPKL
jgi:hypothetical protein